MAKGTTKWLLSRYCVSMPKTHGKLNFDGSGVTCFAALTQKGDAGGRHSPVDFIVHQHCHFRSTVASKTLLCKRFYETDDCMSVHEDVLLFVKSKINVNSMYA